MKKKLLSKFFCIIFIVMSIVGSFPKTTQAYEVKNKVIMNLETSYTFVENNAIEERVSFWDKNGLKTVILNVVHPNGTGIISVEENEKIISEEVYQADYNMYYNLITSNEEDKIETYNSDITGNQYRHRYVGSTSYTYENDAVEVFILGKIGAAAAALTKTLSIPAAIATSLATDIYSFSSAMTKYSTLTVNSHLYEVLRTYDDSYYVHCYHCPYHAYDSGGHLVKSGVEYYQAIGS